MSKSTSTIQGQISTCEKSILEAIKLCEQVAGEHDYDFHFYLQSFKDELESQKSHKDCGIRKNEENIRVRTQQNNGTKRKQTVKMKT